MCSEKKDKPVTNFDSFVSPKQCAILFGIPTDMKQYLDDINNENTNTRDFSFRFSKSEDLFEATLSKWFKFAEKKLSFISNTLGVQVQKNGTLDELKKLANNYNVTILFSHSTKQRIEFRNGLFTADQIIKHIPDGFDRLLDLSICHPYLLVNRLLRDRPACVTIHHPWEISPMLWLSILEIVFIRLQQGEISYPNALKETITEFRKKLY
ncbi:MAG: hypothetical protein H7839_19850 [Magnetococcus sp. YQC-5]